MNTLNEQDYSPESISRTIKSKMLDHEILDKETEKKLFIELERGNLDAKNTIVQHNIKFVVSVAQKYTGKGVSIDDLIQEGILGLYTAVEKFDYKKGNRFLTYASHWVNQKMDTLVSYQGKSVSYPLAFKYKKNLVESKTKELVEKIGRYPTINELSVETKIGPREIKNLSYVGSQMISLDKPIKPGANSTFDEIIDINSGPLSLEEILLREEDNIQLAYALGCLTEKNRRIVEMRYGLLGNEEKTLQEIGDELGVTRQRIRQVLQDSTTKMSHILKHGINKKLLDDFLNAM